MYTCIYHGNCLDGFASAWVVRKAIHDEIVFHSATYQSHPPDVKDRDVIITDFSYKRPVLLEMAQDARSILILDHHKSALEDLVDLPKNVTTIFDTSRCGAMITWQHYFAKKEAPRLIHHIQDRDLWRFEFPHTREINAALFSYPYDFDLWDQLMSMNVDTLAEEGEAINRKLLKDVNELLPIVTREMIIGGYRVPVANLPYTMASEAGHILCKDKPFAACYYDSKTERVFSLRSDKDNGMDVAKIAQLYGGGGHQNAAGFKIPFRLTPVFETFCEKSE